MRLVRVSLSERSYPILVGRGLLEDLGSWIKKQDIHQKTALVVSQKQIAVYYQKQILEALTREGFEVSFFITPAAKSSEAAKSEFVYSKLLRRIASLDGMNRSVLLVAMGGGVIGDLTGFAASVYRRGIPYVQVPTTLTAQVDSAIGGKTGIDIPEGKNLVGSIYQPRLVLSDLALLSSLSERHWSDGFAEVIKYGVIKDASLFTLLERLGMEGVRANPVHLERIISRCAKIKAQVVSRDEWDKKGIRILLNFGHTAAHAIEAAAGFSGRYTHGEAVSVGMLVACDISRSLGVLKDLTLATRLEKTLLKFNLPVFYRGLSLESIVKAIGYDKKSEKGANRFVLPVSLGRMTVVRDVPIRVITEALQKRRR